MASISSPLHSIARFARAFAASKKGLKPAQYVPRIGLSAGRITEHRRKIEILRSKLADAYRYGDRNEIKAGIATNSEVLRGTPAPLSHAERYGGIVGSAYRKPAPVQLSLPGMEPEAGSAIGLSHRQLAISKVKTALSNEPPINAFLKGKNQPWVGGRTPYGPITSQDTHSAAYRLGKLFRPGVPLSRSIPDLSKTLNTPGSRLHNLRWDLWSKKTALKRALRLHNVGNVARKAALGTAKVATGAVENVTGKINAATANRWSFPTRIRLKPQAEFNSMSESTGAGRSNIFHVTAGHAPLTNIRAKAEEYGRKVVIAPEAGLGSQPIPHDPNVRFSLHPGARMGERVKNLRQAFSEMRKQYPGAHDWQMDRLNPKGSKAGARMTRTLRYTRPDRKH